MERRERGGEVGGGLQFLHGVLESLPFVAEPDANDLAIVAEALGECGHLAAGGMSVSGEELVEDVEGLGSEAGASLALATAFGGGEGVGRSAEASGRGGERRRERDGRDEHESEGGRSGRRLKGRRKAGIACGGGEERGGRAEVSGCEGDGCGGEMGTLTAR